MELKIDKATLLHRVWDVTIGGDDEEVVFHERPEIQAMRAEPDLTKRFMMHACWRLAAAPASDWAKGVSPVGVSFPAAS